MVEATTGRVLGQSSFFLYDMVFLVDGVLRFPFSGWGADGDQAGF